MFDKMSRAVPVLFLKAGKSRPLVSTLSVILFLALWELLPRWGFIDVSYASQPSRVFAAALEIVRKGDFSAHLYVSFVEFSVGFALALIIGIPVGMMIGVSRNLRYLLDPPIMAIWSTPRIALIPILIVWLGIGVESKMAVVLFGAVIPIIVNTVAGIRSSDPSLTQAARSFCATQRDIFIRVLLPDSLPAVMSGIRLGLGRGIVGVVVGEMYVSTMGVGHQIMRYGQAFRVDHLLVYLVLVSFFGFITTSLVRNLEIRLQRWSEP